MAAKNVTQKALTMISRLPRVSLYNIANPVFEKKPSSFHVYGKKRNWGQKGRRQRGYMYYLGYEGGQTPWWYKIPYEPYNKDHHLKRSYPPISLGLLQLLVDTNRIDPSKPIDMTSLSNTKIFKMSPLNRDFGFQLTDEGLDTFKAKVHIEVQYAKEHVIAAIERNGGTITLAYYDATSVWAASDPAKYFAHGRPIPRRELPPQNAIELYTSAESRGYLADPEKIAEHRMVLAQKYGYTLPDLSTDPQSDMLLMRKDPRQVFHGLEPGWYVNLKEKKILRPTDPDLAKYYQS
ncbi:MRPL15 [Cordylochernes scorpioides]|uniref:Large ribosomal subunit protein uL15m n=1 Tax=Cordylochernes scorpioides TaxID=51811 RepID=A0ABY6L7U3_9ARAC|nr:MRPL15 [Cordylochernes scorpioides]